jgi:signal peptidase
MKPIKPIQPKLINYMGPSMNPTLRSGDGLRIKPYDGKEIRCGDVIVFIPLGDGRKITHRVISVDSQGTRTKGDNNTQVDPFVLSPDNIIGRVVYAQRGNKRRKVFGGPTGQLFSVAVRALKMFDSRISYLLRPPYNWIVRTGVFSRFMHRLIKPKVISLIRPEGTELQLLIGERVIGRLLPGKSRWQIKRPFRLFVDEQSLPRNLLK